MFLTFDTACIFVDFVSWAGLSHQQDSTTTSCGDILRCYFWHRWKAESLRFASVPKLASEDITARSCGRIFLVARSRPGHQIHQNPGHLKSLKHLMSATVRRLGEIQPAIASPACGGTGSLDQGSRAPSATSPSIFVRRGCIRLHPGLGIIIDKLISYPNGN